MRGVVASSRDHQGARPLSHHRFHQSNPVLKGSGMHFFARKSAGLTILDEFVEFSTLDGGKNFTRSNERGDDESCESLIACEHMI